MTSRTTQSFQRAFAALPADVQGRARRAFRLWSSNPAHRSLQFKQVHATRPVYSVRIGLGWRALAVKREDLVVWTWIGSHADYDRLLSSL
ncbi:MAG: hypothetical protein ACRD24_14940 [Terriglobales bacterium]